MLAYRLQREQMENRPVLGGDLTERVYTMAQLLSSIPEQALGHLGHLGR